MSKLAVIGTFYGRHENSFPILHRLFTSTRTIDELWLMCEEEADYDALRDAYDALRELDVAGPWPQGWDLVILHTPKETDGSYAVIPYSHKINWALDHSEADLVCYLDNNSMPAAEKYQVMAEGLELHPEWGAVYCTQKRTGFNETVMEAIDPIPDAFCVLNYTQVMHRITADRWPLDMNLANPDLADATFWRLIQKHYGDIQPVGGSLILDDHHIPAPHAVGL